MRSTKSAKVALARLAAEMEHRGSKVEIRPTERKGYFTMRLRRGPGLPRVEFAARKLADHLALLVEAALQPREKGGCGMTRVEISDAVKLHDAPKSSKGWMQETLDSLTPGAAQKWVDRQKKKAKATAQPVVAAPPPRSVQIRAPRPPSAKEPA